MLKVEGAGVGLGLVIGVGTGVALGDGVALGLGFGVATGVGTGVATGVGTGVATGVGTGVATGVGAGFDDPPKTYAPRVHTPEEGRALPSLSVVNVLNRLIPALIAGEAEVKWKSVVPLTKLGLIFSRLLV
jgi:hypothetical protein